MPEVFERKHLRDLVQIVGRALQKEDESLREPLLSKAVYRKDGVPGMAGLYRANIEHFYQYIAWKALVRSDFPFALIPEHGKRDLWFCESAVRPEPATAVGEMKCWDTEPLPKTLRKDIKARQRDSGCPGFILLTTVQDPKNWDANRKFLVGGLADLGVKEDDFETFPFPVFWREGENIREHEFRLIGFMANPVPKP